ncbi:MAG: phytanoyl-CoA dioxygenase family protein [Chthoniobacter sp.]|nr:phytanoyl-CoA dioxygenase family protein [Chthoniobacter sp.]
MATTTTSADVTLTTEQIAFFREHGFLRMERICPPDEVEFLREVYDRLFAEQAGRGQGAQFDMVGLDEDGKPQASPQIINPVFFAPELKETSFRRSALAVARQLLGPEAFWSFEHAILKPAGIGAPTPWHQDEAFRRNHPPGYQEISIWMPLQIAAEENGCLEFIPGTNRGPVLRHASPGGDPRVHALECVEGFDPANAVACPLPPGGCTIHHCRTLHHAGPNRSTIPRRAYIQGFALPTEGNPRLSPEFSWNVEKQTANQQRKKAWRMRGGVLTEIGRKVRARWARLVR